MNKKYRRSSVPDDMTGSSMALLVPRTGGTSPVSARSCRVESARWAPAETVHVATAAMEIVLAISARYGSGSS